MEKEMILQRIEQWKLLADLFVKNNSRVFIKTWNGNLHFCNIILNQDDLIKVNNFGPEQRAGETNEIYWLDIQEFQPYKEASE